MTRGGDAEIIVDINTTPLIDVMLVLLVMLIITIPIQLHAINLEMPVGTPPSVDVIKPDKVQIDIDEQGAIYWQSVLVTLPALERKIGELGRSTPQPEVHLRPHKDCQYSVFVNVLSASRREGLSKLTVIGSEQFVP